MLNGTMVFFGNITEYLTIALNW